MSDLTKNKDSNNFFENVAEIIEQARRFVGRTADLTMCVTYFEVGRMIVEEEQGGKTRAEYGRGLMLELAKFLTEKFGRGFSLSTLKNAKQFYNVYVSLIGQTPLAEKSQTLTGFFENKNLTGKKSYPFNLSWSHYLILMRIKDDQERRFYEIEAAKQQWTYRQLQRQYGSSLYERRLSILQPSAFLLCAY